MENIDRHLCMAGKAHFKDPGVRLISKVSFDLIALRS